MSISIPLTEFAPSSLICLASKLRERYRERTTIIVSIFSSPKAAFSAVGFLTDLEDTMEERAALAHLHARYIYFADRHEEYVEILPAGVTTAHTEQPYETRIDLPAETTPHCKLEIDNRCLIAVQQFPYPAKLLKGKPSGPVTLAATITRSGNVDHVRVVKAESIAPNEAVHNLLSWRLEPGPREEPIHITYSYSIDNSLRRVDGMQVQWALPNAVSIRVPSE